MKVYITDKILRNNSFQFSLLNKIHDRKFESLILIIILLEFYQKQLLN